MGANALFIQVGTNEWRVHRRAARGSHDVYYAFWSDAVHHFHPIDLFALRPGDEVSARLTLDHRRWKVAISDTTSGAARRFFTSDEGHGLFNQAKWEQEDVTNSATGKPYPYPRLSTVAFRGLAVNSTAPTYTNLFSAWMAENDRSLAPSRLDDDAFTLRAATLSPAGKRYLISLEPLDRAAVKFYAQTAGWTASTPAAQIKSESAAFIAALSDGIHALAVAPWPANAQVPIGILTSHLQAVMAQTRSLATTSQSRLGAWKSAFDNVTYPVGGDEDVARETLNVPQITPYR